MLCWPQSHSTESHTAHLLNLCGNRIPKVIIHPWLIKWYLPSVSSCPFSSEWPESVRLYEGPLLKLMALSKSQEQISSLTRIIYHFLMLHAVFGHVQ